MTNGSAALIINFGDYVKANHKVAVLVQRETSGKMEVIFYMNGDCLGAGFRLQQFGTDEVLYPSISVTGKAKVSFGVPAELPGTTERSNASGKSGYIGDWKLNKFRSGPELHEFLLPAAYDIIMTVDQQEQDPTKVRFRLSVKVVNTLRCNLEIVGKSENFDKISVGGVMSTMMMPPPQLQTVEQLVTEALPTFQKMIISGTNLIMTAPTAEFSASRFAKSFEPLASYYI